MKVVLIEPIYFFQRWPFELYGTKNYFQIEPLSLLQVAAHFPNESIIIDGMNDKRITPKWLARFLSRINDPNTVVGIASHSNVGAMNTLYTLKLIKHYAPQATVIMGGYHATFFHKIWIKLGADVVCRNEGEITFAKITNKITNNEKNQIVSDDLLGATYSAEWLDRINQFILGRRKRLDKNREGAPSPKRWKKVFDLPLFSNPPIITSPNRPFVENLDELPLPLREKLNFRWNALPIEGQGFSSNIEMSRGCPFNCEYCSTRVMWNRIVRFKSAERTIMEIKQCISLGIKKLLFVDESWGSNRSKYMEFLHKLEEEHLDFKWGIQIRTDTIMQNPDMIRYAGKLGCRLALVGYESLNQKTIDQSSKGIYVHDFFKVKQILTSASILVFGYFLIGLPGETEKERKRTISYMNSLAEVSFLQQFVPYFGGTYSGKQNSHPIFMLDTQHIMKTVRSTDEKRRINEITKKVRYSYLRFLLNPKNLVEMFYAPTIVRKSKKVFLWFVYSRLINNILKFRPQHLLYFLKGK